MKNAFLFELNEITKDSELFNQFKNQNIFFYYFQNDQKYYLFIFREKPISLDFIQNFPEIKEIRKIDAKKRQLRSLRGFMIYVLEMINTNPNVVIATNLEPFFWPDVERVLKKRKKNGIEEFLFGKKVQEVEENIEIQLQEMKNEMQEMRNEMKKFHSKVSQIEKLESEISLLKNIFSQQGDFTVSNYLRDDQKGDIKKDQYIES